MRKYDFLKRSNYCFVFVSHSFTRILVNKAENKSGKLSYEEFKWNFIYILFLKLLKIILVFFTKLFEVYVASLFFF